MRLSHNLASLNVYRSYVKNLKNQSSAMDRISSGIKINGAGEDPNKIAQSENYRMQIRGLQMASRNSQDGMSMLQTAEGGMNGITSSIQRIRELLVQAGGTTTIGDRDVIKSEISQMIDSIDNLSQNTEFNGVKLLSDTSVLDNSNPNYLSTVTGSSVGEKIDIPKFNLTSKGLNLKDSAGNLNIDVEDIDSSLKLIDNALGVTLSAQSKYGALENRFESSYNNLLEIADKTQGAESSIRDADIAGEMMKVAKNNVLVDAGNAMMVQTNKFPQDILRILENVRSR